MAKSELKACLWWGGEESGMLVQKHQAKVWKIKSRMICLVYRKEQCSLCYIYILPQFGKWHFTQFAFAHLYLFCVYLLLYLFIYFYIVIGDDCMYCKWHNMYDVYLLEVNSLQCRSSQFEVIILATYEYIWKQPSADGAT